MKRTRKVVYPFDERSAEPLEKLAKRHGGIKQIIPVKNPKTGETLRIIIVNNPILITRGCV